MHADNHRNRVYVPVSMALAKAALLSMFCLATGCETPSASGGGSSASMPSLFGPAPIEEPWAVRCITLRGADRFRYAKRYEELLKQVKELDPALVQVLHDESASTVYYGRYKRNWNPSTGKATYQPDHQRDLHMIQTLAFSDSSVWPFKLASMEALPVGGAEKPEWDLRGAKGVWSLQVAVFYNSEQMNSRKHAALEYCKLLREQGYEAYYHHGIANSSVTIGAFPREALQSIEKDLGVDPTTGTNVKGVQSRIVDERMLDLQRKFPNNTENGHIFYEIIRDPQTGEVKQRIPRASFPVEIPRRGQSEP
ncbi:MAG: hypothetical protein JNG88_12720 [Phycisphaerales bacterium]|nr:hypothetical protein [Phycisphaerales bacterium]